MTEPTENLWDTCRELIKSYTPHDFVLTDEIIEKTNACFFTAGADEDYTIHKAHMLRYERLQEFFYETNMQTFLPRLMEAGEAGETLCARFIFESGYTPALHGSSTLHGSICRNVENFFEIVRRMKSGQNRAIALSAKELAGTIRTNARYEKQEGYFLEFIKIMTDDMSPDQIYSILSNSTSFSDLSEHSHKEQFYNVVMNLPTRQQSILFSESEFIFDIIHCFYNARLDNFSTQDRSGSREARLARLNTAEDMGKDRYKKGEIKILKDVMACVETYNQEEKEKIILHEKTFPLLVKNLARDRSLKLLQSTSGSVQKLALILHHKDISFEDLLGKTAFTELVSKLSDHERNEIGILVMVTLPIPPTMDNP